MDLDQLTALRSPAGQFALARAAELAPDESTYLACFNKLSKHVPGELARAALETAMLRRRARPKFRLADRMYFTREALEQASSEAVAGHRARRFAGLGAVGDLCCGIGGDALALAGQSAVVAVDLDPLRLEMARLNVEAYGRADRAAFLGGDVLTLELPRLDAAFVDPDRRVEGRRVLSVRACQPPLPDLLSRLPRGVPVCVKLAPGVPLGELSAFEAELEFVSLGGELKECALWLGAFRSARRRATLLPGGRTLTEGAAGAPGVGPPGEWLLDPDPAVVRAGLVGELAHQVGAHLLDAQVAYLTTPRRVETPFAKLFAVEASLPFHLGRLRDLLRERGVGHVQVSRRGSPVEPEELTRRLKLRGDGRCTVVLTRAQGRPWALVCQPAGREGAT
jgi:hypothetical protein